MLVYNNILFSQVYMLPSDDFEKKVIGDTLYLTFKNGRYIGVPNKGLAKDRPAVEHLILDLKARYEQENKKKHSSDAEKAVLSYRIAHCYWAIMLYDTLVDYKTELSQFHLKTLHYARKIRDKDLTNHTYSQLTSSASILSVPQRIKLLKDWIKDFNAWSSESDDFARTNSPYESLANLYESVGDYDNVVNILTEFLNTTPRDNMKAYIHKWLAEFYHRHDKFKESVSHQYEFIRLFPAMHESNHEAAQLAHAYRAIAEYKISNNEWVEALALIPKINYKLYCTKCSMETTNVDKYFTNIRNLYLAQIYIAKNELLNAKDHLQKIEQSGLHPKILNKTWADYYAAIGDTLHAYRYLDTYAKSAETMNKNLTNSLRLRTKNSFDLAKSYESALVSERAEQEKLLQKQKILAYEKEVQLDKIKAETENQLLLARAEQAEYEKKIEKERLETAALQNKKEQDYKISLLNQDIKQQKRKRLQLWSGLTFITLLAGGLYYNNRQKQQTNRTLTKQKYEIDQQAGLLTKQKQELELSLEQLQKAQAQLIQSEKLASLGELTAGIAHEIQNPLNFVNNFSEVNAELIEEAKLELRKGNHVEAEVIINDLKANQEKITHHGQRADAIVKSMLQHSRTSSGQKELTDINALCNEYLRLAYHGFRAKDKSFQATFETNFDPVEPNLKLSRQDIGRVLLNLINNAFYAVHEKSKHHLTGYEPKVIVTTQLMADNQLLIGVKDNGTGIPLNTKAKIFQPFFTTKPTGQGTGLGLSLAYDIVTKGHGGELKVDTVEGEGTAFFMLLPA